MTDPTTTPPDAGDLAACPFCGMPAVIHQGGDGLTVRCRVCPCEMFIGRAAVAEAAALWNRRAPNPELEALRAALRNLMAVEMAPGPYLSGGGMEALDQARAALAREERGDG